MVQRKWASAFHPPALARLLEYHVTNHYDLIVISSGARGASLTQRLAATGKRVLLKRGDYLPSEDDN